MTTTQPSMTAFLTQALLPIYILTISSYREKTHFNLHLAAKSEKIDMYGQDFCSNSLCFGLLSILSVPWKVSLCIGVIVSIQQPLSKMCTNDTVSPQQQQEKQWQLHLNSQYEIHLASTSVDRHALPADVSSNKHTFP